MSSVIFVSDNRARVYPYIRIKNYGTNVVDLRL